MMMNDKSRRLKPKQSPFGKQDLKQSSRMMGREDTLEEEMATHFNIVA